MDAEKLNQALYDKMAAEQERFKHGLLGMTAEEALDHAYEYAIREDILMALEFNDLPAPQAAALLESPSPLADVFKGFRDMETAHMDHIRECIEDRAENLLEAKREATRSIPLYRQSGEYAREHGELDAFLASLKANIACRDAIEAAIQDGFDGMSLHADTKSVLAAFGAERVSHVLAATLQGKRSDARISSGNQAWAATVPMFDTVSRHRDYLITSHPGVLSIFVTQARKEMDAMRERQESLDLSGLIANPHLYSTINANLRDAATDELIEAIYDYAGQYQEAISRSIESFHSQAYPSNDLMQYFKLPDNPKMEGSIRQKIQSAYVTVEASGPCLYARLDLSMSADLTINELEAFTAQIESQYRDGWGAELELLTIPAGKDAVCLRLWHDDISFFPATEKSRFEQRDQQEQSNLKAVSTRKPSIKAQLAAKSVPGDQPTTKPKDREVR